MGGSEIKKLRELPLDFILESFGSYRDPKDPEKNWRTSVGRMTITGSKFYNHEKEIGGGGAIDLVMHLGGLDLNKAIGWLSGLENNAVLKQYEMKQYKKKKEPPGIPPPVEKNLFRVRRYLKFVRAIPASIVEEKIRNNDLWADEYGNAVFSLKNMDGVQVGAEIRGTCAKPFHGIRGNKSGFFFAGTWQSKEAVFVEAAIDALSYEALEGPALILSTTGTVKKIFVEACRILKGKGFDIVAGFDDDKDGDRLACALDEAAGGGVARKKPALGKDWNALLREKYINHLEGRGSYEQNNLYFDHNFNE